MSALCAHSLSTPGKASRRYCGRTFTAEEMDRIRSLIAAKPQRNRHQLSRAVCEQFDWRGPAGRLKAMSCRVAMLRMHRDGLIRLPLPQRGNGNGRSRPKITALSDPQPLLGVPVDTLGPITLRTVRTQKESALWNELIQRYHYLGYTPLPGAQLRYLFYSHSQLLGALGFGAAAWLAAPRDSFIGWNHRQRKTNLHLVINNARFLLLPWISVKNLASKTLAEASKRLPSDWKQLYGYQPVLLETFVECGRFHGSSYRAANWTYVGKTTGRGKLEKTHNQVTPIKDILLYPLDRQFRNILCSPPNGL